MNYINHVELQGMTSSHAQAITHQNDVIRIDFRVHIKTDVPKLEGIDNVHAVQFIRVQVLTLPGYATHGFQFRPNAPIHITGMFVDGGIEALTADYVEEE